MQVESRDPQRLVICLICKLSGAELGRIIVRIKLVRKSGAIYFQLCGCVNFLG